MALQKIYEGVIFRQEKLAEKYAVNNLDGRKSFGRFFYNLELFTYGLALFLIEALAIFFLETKDSFLIFAHRHKLLSTDRQEQSSLSGLESKDGPSDAQSFAYSYTRHKQMVGRVRFFTKSAFLCIVVSTIVTSTIVYFLMPGRPGANAATFNFIQSAFSGGADLLSFPIHPTNQSNWDKYFSKDENINAGDDISLNNPVGSWAQTSDTDFNGGSFDHTAVSGTGSGAGIVASANSSYGYYKTITVDHTKVSSTDQSNFPMLVSITDNSFRTVANGGRIQNSSGYDIIFINTSGTQLDHEIESYDGTTGTIVMWVKIPTLSASTDTVIYIYYGNSGITTSQENKAGVWDSNYKGVWHLNEIGTNPTVNDSSSSAQNSSSQTWTPTTSGKVGNGGSFDGTQKITFANFSQYVSNSPITLEGWFKLNSSGDYYTAFGLDRNVSPDTNNFYAIYSWNNSFEARFRNSSGTAYTLTPAAAISNWSHIAFVLDGSNLFFYVNGSVVASNDNVSGVINTDTLSLLLGDLGEGWMYWIGTMDEIHASNTVRSADWIATEYNNQNAPSAFYAVGAENSVIAQYFSSSHLSSSSVTYTTLAFTSSGGNGFPSAFSSYENRKPITVDHTKVSNTDQTNFPMLVSLTNDDFKTVANGGKIREENGYDIVFSSTGGTRLDHEIESYDGTAGTIMMWVKIPIISASTDTVIYIYYGNSGITTSQENKSGVWNDGGNNYFKGVWHLGETGTGSTEDYKDSTQYSNNSTNTTDQPTVTASGRIGSGEIFNGTSSFVDMGNDSSLNIANTITVGAWIFINGDPDGVRAGIIGNGENNYLLSQDNVGEVGGYPIRFYCAGSFTYEFNRPSNTWYYLVSTYDGITMSTYLNGELITSRENTALMNTTNAVQIGRSVDRGTHFNGIVDEARISNIARSADWIATEYNNQNSPSTFYTLDSETPLRFQLRSANELDALNSATWYGPTGTGDYYTASGTMINPIHNGQKYIQYRAILGNVSVVLDDVTLGMHAADTLTSSPYNIGDITAVLSDFSWSQTLPDGAEVKFQIRATADSGGAPDSSGWTDWVGPDGTNGTFFTNPSGGVAIPDVLRSGGKQWVQYRLYMSATDTSPTVDDINLQYTINAQPQVAVVSATQGTDSSISVNYTLSDADTSDPHTAYVSAFLDTVLNESLTSVDQTAITVTNIVNFPNSGTILIDDEMIAYTGKSGNDLIGITRHTLNTTATSHTLAAEIYILGTSANITGDIGDIGSATPEPADKALVWSASSDIPNVYLANLAKVKVSVNDGNGAYQIGTGASSALDIWDTKAPAVSSILINGSQAADNITLSVTDDDPGFQMKYSTSESGLDALSYSPYSATATISLGGQSTVYFRFIDWKGNVTNYTLNIPTKATNPLVQDVSNVSTAQYRLFVSFDAVPDPANGFGAYHIYTADSVDGTYTEIPDTNLTVRTVNYYLDQNLTEGQTKYYRIAASDSLGNIADLSDAVSATANGYQDGGEGNGEGTIPPVITHDPLTQITDIADTGATISFATDKTSDSAILFSTDTSYSQEQGVPTMIVAPNVHSVTLAGLAENTTYYYKIVSRDALGNAGELEDSQTQTFTTTTDTTAPQIENITATPSDTACTITFTTTKASSIRIDYGTDTNYSQNVTNANLNLDHSITISGLSENTVYHYRITATDGTVSHNNSNSGDLTFTTVTLPSITFDSDAGITNVTATRATITFTTNKNTNSLIDYSTTQGVFTSTQGNYSDSTTFHIVTLTGLNPETTYYFQLRVSDGTNEAAENNSGVGYTFTTLTSSDSTAPVISGVTIGAPAANSVTVSWTTDEPSSSLVDFGTTLSFGKTQGNGGELVTSHSITLTGLSASTSYLLRVKSADETGNLRTDDNGSQGYAFATPASEVSPEEDSTAPVITFNDQTGITNVTPTSATISWTTDEEADSAIGYGLNTSFSQQKGSSDFATSHTIALTNLSPNSAYKFEIRSQDRAGNISTDNNGGQGYSFTTLSGSDRVPPVISNVQAGTLSGSSVTITWTTDENSSSLVEYGVAQDSLSQTGGNYTELVSSHSVTLSGLSATTLYYFRVRSQDSSQNYSIDDGGSSPYNFTTLSAENICPVISSGGGGGSSKDTTPPQISAVKVSNISSSGATITWTTNESGYSVVEYDKDEKYADSILKGNREKFVQDHSVQLTNLSSNVKYFYTASSADSSGNLAKSQALVFTTLPVGSSPEQKDDLKQQTEEKIKELVQSGLSEQEIKSIIAGASLPVKIASEGPKVSDITNISAKVSWITDKKSNSVVRFRVKGETVEKEFGNFSDLQSEHSVALVNLSSGVSYEYQVQSSDVLGNTSKSEWHSFATSVTPSIYDVTVSDINLSSVTLEWKTNVPASEQLEYGTDINYSGKFEGKSSDKSTVHIVKLNNLQSGRLYHYRIKGIDVNGNILSSDDYTFVTYTLPQVVEYSVVSINERQANIKWATNVESDSAVRYIDSATGEAKSQGEDNLTKTHDFILKGLEPGKTYTVQIQGRDAYGNQAVSGEFELKTPADVTAPKFGRVSVETAISSGKGNQVRTIISYTTDEPSTTQVFYKQGAGDDNYTQSTDPDNNLTTNHVIVITDFKPATVYKFKLQGSDSSGNKGESQAFTVLVPEEKKSVIQMITQNLENTFGWLKKIKN